MPSVNDKIADRNINRAVRINRFAAGSQRRMRKFLRELERDLVARLSRFEPGSRTDTQRRRLREHLALVRNTIRESYSTIRDELNIDLRGVAGTEAEFARNVVNSAAKAELITTGFSGTQLNNIVSSSVIIADQAGTSRVTNAEYFRRAARDVEERYASAIRFGVAQGETTPDLVRRVRRDIMPLATRFVNTRVRTSVQTIANDTKNQMWSENADVIEAVQWVSTLDARTSDICKVRDGKIWTLPDYAPVGHGIPWNGGPPAHPNCRSVSTPIVRSLEELGRKGSLIPQATRASIDGQVPSDVNFEQWLEGKSESFQNKALGKGKAELWRSGQISFADLVDFRGNPLTLEQLENET